MRFWNGAKMKRLSKYSLFASLIFVGISVVVAMFAPSSTDISIEDFGPHEEADFSIEGAMDELAQEDRWMLQFIDPPADVDPKNVYTFECEIPSRKPTIMTTTCADFGEVVQKIKWSKWAADGAEGVGEYSINDCDPDCADGNFKTVPVKVYLSNLTTNGKSFFFNTLIFSPEDEFLVPGSYKTKNGLIFPGSAVIDGKEVPAITWDVASFYREVPDMRTELP
jgi:hypothetical protein